jgi:hypothetical protein
MRRGSLWVPSPAGDNPQVDFRLAKAGFFRGNAHVAGQGQLAAAPQAGAVDYGNDGQVKGFHFVKKVLALFDQAADLFLAVGGEGQNVGPGNKGLGEALLIRTTRRSSLARMRSRAWPSSEMVLRVQGVDGRAVQGYDSQRLPQS